MIAMMEDMKKAYTKHNMGIHFVEDIEAGIKFLLTHIPTGSTIGLGGSITLEEIGIMKLLREGNYQLLDRYREDLSDDERIRLFQQSFSAKIFLTSSNAITVDGYLVNKDGRGTRMAPVVYGPEKVWVVVGKNKISKTIADGLHRIEHIAAPKNNVRLKTGTPCTKTGVCEDCNHPNRICCHTVISGFQRIKNRIEVLVINTDLGY